MPTLLDAAPAVMPGMGNETDPSTLAIGAPAVHTDSRNPTIEEDAVAKMVLERMAVSERFDRPFKERALLHFQQVNSILPSSWPRYSKYFEPVTSDVAWENLETVMGPVFSKDTIHNIKALDDQGDVERELTNIVLGDVLKNYVHYKDMMFFQFQEGTWYGNGVLRHVILSQLVRESRNVPQIIGGEYGIKVGMQRQETQKWVVAPAARVVSRFDCYPAPTGATIQKMPYFIERLIITLDEVKALGASAGWRHTDDLDGFFALDRTEGNALGEWSERMFDLYERLAAVGYDVRGGGNDIYGQNCVKYVELLIYSQAPASGPGADRIIIVGNRKYQVWDSAWPRPGAPKGGNPHQHGLKPYSEVKFKPISGQVWQAKGIPAMLEDQQMKLNMLSNAASDMIAQQLDPMTLIEHDAGVEDLSDLTRLPGARLRVNRAQGIVDWKAPQVPGEVFKEMDTARLNMKITGAAPDAGRGIIDREPGQKGSTDTLGGLQNLLTESAQAKNFTALMSERGVEEGLAIILSDLQQTMSTPMAVKVPVHNKVLQGAGIQGNAQVQPEQIQGRYHVEVLSYSRAMDSGTRAKMLAQAGMMAKEMPEVAKRLKQFEIWKEVNELSGLDGPERFLRTDEEQQQFEQQMSQIPHPNPDMAKALGMKYEKLPPDIQREAEQAVGFIPSQQGGSSPLETHIAKAITKIPHNPGKPAQPPSR